MPSAAKFHLRTRASYPPPTSSLPQGLNRAALTCGSAVVICEVLGSYRLSISLVSTYSTLRYYRLDSRSQALLENVSIEALLRVPGFWKRSFQTCVPKRSLGTSTRVQSESVISNL